MGALKGTRPPNAGKGRVKGTPNKVTRELKVMIEVALENAGGVEYLQKVAKGGLVISVAIGDEARRAAKA